MNRTIARYAMAIVFVFVCCRTSTTAAQPAVSTFEVKFDGLIVHDLDPRHPQRALIIQGDASMPHVPLLVTEADIHEDALAAATGQPVFCGQASGEATITCRVFIDGFDMQIVGSDGSRALPSLEEDTNKTFSRLTPHLSRVTGGKLLDVVTAPTPPPGIAGFFELTGGTLSACRFKASGYFVPDLDNEKNRYFADVVSLNGHVDPAARAILQIRSKATKGQWMSVAHDAATPLKIVIDNHAPRKHGVLMASTHHFDLVSKLLDLSAGIFPVVCAAPPQSSDALCFDNVPSGFPDAGTFAMCPPRSTVRTSTAPALELLPGCANSTWP